MGGLVKHTIVSAERTTRTDLPEVAVTFKNGHEWVFCRGRKNRIHLMRGPGLGSPTALFPSEYRAAREKVGGLLPFVVNQ